MIIMNFLESLLWWYNGRTQTFKWYPHFRRVQTLVQNCEHTGRQSSNQTDKNVWKVCQVTREERQRTINNWCYILGLSYSACQCTSINIWTWDKLLQNLCLSSEWWPETKQTFCVKGPVRSGQKWQKLLSMVFLFQKMKIHLKGQLFKDTAVISWLQWCWTASWNRSFSYASSSGRRARPSV
jgi:hypothetical protein